MRALLLSVSLLLVACGGRGTLYTSPLRALPAVATTGAVVSVVPTTNRAVVVRPGVITPTALRLTPGARVARAVPGADALLVLGGTARAPTVDVVDLEANTVETLALPGAFDVITFSPDGRFAVFTYDAGAATGALVARNLNEVGLLHLPSRTVSRLQLDTESLAPRGVLFAASEANRQLVAVSLERGVALFDALHPEVPTRRITIRPPGTASESSVLEAVFSRDVKWLFLRASALDDVIAIELGSEVGSPPSASLNFVSGGQGLMDLEPAPDGYPDAVLAAYQRSAELYLLDARGIQDRTKRLSAGANVTQVRALGGSKVLAFGPQATNGVVAWDLADGRSGTAFLDSAPSGVHLLASSGKAVFFHTTSTGSTALSTVTVTEETNRLRLRLQSIQLAAWVLASTLDEVHGRLFFAVSGSSSVVTLDVATLRLLELPLNAQSQVLAWLPGPDVVAAINSSADHQGDVTLFPAGATARGEATRYTDFFFTGDLDRTEAP